MHHGSTRAVVQAKIVTSYLSWYQNTFLECSIQPSQDYTCNENQCRNIGILTVCPHISCTSPRTYKMCAIRKWSWTSVLSPGLRHVQMSSMVTSGETLHSAKMGTTAPTVTLAQNSNSIQRWDGSQWLFASCNAKAACIAERMLFKKRNECIADLSILCSFQLLSGAFLDNAFRMDNCICCFSYMANFNLKKWNAVGLLDAHLWGDCVCM